MYIQGSNGKEHNRREDIPSQHRTEENIGDSNRQPFDNGAIVNSYKLILETEVGTALVLEKYLEKSLAQSKKIVGKLSDKQITKLGKMYLQSTNFDPALKYTLISGLFTIIKIIGGTNTTICENCGSFMDEDLCKCPKCNTYHTTVCEEKDEKKPKRRNKKLRTT